MADPISGMMNFSDIADDSAKMRRDAVAADTNIVSNMMNATPVADDVGSRSTGFMPGIEGEGLSPDIRARTYSETDDTRNFRSSEELGSFKTPAPGSGTLDRNNTVIPGDRLNFNGNQDEFKDRARLKGFPRPTGISGGRMYQREI